MSEKGQEERKIYEDEEWKEQAKREAEAMQKAIDAERQARQAPMPAASFTLLVQSLVSQALVALGDAENPLTGQRQVELDMARFHIDMLGVLEEKTKGNLTRQEENFLRGWLFDLRLRFVNKQEAARTANLSETETASPKSQ